MTCHPCQLNVISLRRGTYKVSFKNPDLSGGGVLLLLQTQA